MLTSATLNHLVWPLRGARSSAPQPPLSPTDATLVEKVVCQQVLLHSPSSCLLPLPRVEVQLLAGPRQYRE